MEWHIVTGEYPPQLGGVSDYTLQVTKELAKEGDQVHVWAPVACEEGFQQDHAVLHALPRGFGWRWLRELNRRLRSFTGPRNLLIQYVPHMYGWKSMNLAFCLWVCLQRRHNVSVMFHEVAFPLRRGGPWRHGLLAVVHRLMAAAIVRSAKHSFTSNDPYLALLRKLGGPKARIGMLRICSNIPSDSYRWEASPEEDVVNKDGFFTVGIFSNFGSELREVLTPVIGGVLENPQIAVNLLGPGEGFREALKKQFPQAADRIHSTGHLHVREVAAHMQSCNALLQIYPDGASAARGTLVGAMASGVPVVTTSGPATDRLLLESGTMLFSSPSPNSVREALETLMANRARARELGTGAQRLYQESFQPAVIVSRLRDMASNERYDEKAMRYRVSLPEHVQ